MNKKTENQRGPGSADLTREFRGKTPKEPYFCRRANRKAAKKGYQSLPERGVRAGDGEAKFESESGQ